MERTLTFSPCLANLCLTDDIHVLLNVEQDRVVSGGALINHSESIIGDPIRSAVRSKSVFAKFGRDKHLERFCGGVDKAAGEGENGWLCGCRECRLVRILDKDPSVWEEIVRIVALLCLAVFENLVHKLCRSLARVQVTKFGRYLYWDFGRDKEGHPGCVTHFDEKERR